MSTYQPELQIQLTPMPGLAEAVDSEDDWTGVTDATARRKRQTRLNVRAYRRRRKILKKQAQAQAQTQTSSISPSQTSVTKSEPEIPCWVEDQQRVSILPVSVTGTLTSKQTPLIPWNPIGPRPVATSKPPNIQIIFPLCSDHLIILLQYNVLRACITNRALLSRLTPAPTTTPTTETTDSCTTAALHVLPLPSHPLTLPPSLYPTKLQLTIPHESWVDIIPHQRWRDNVLMAIGTFDEDGLWSDTIGGLFEGFPDEESGRRGVISWGEPWSIEGWEVSEGFWRKWDWSFDGCGDILAATNRWRKERGETELI